MRKLFNKLSARFVARLNVEKLKKLAGMSVNYAGTLSADEETLLDLMVERAQAGRFITRKGLIVYAIKPLEQVAIWNVIEARRAESNTDMIKAWCGDYAPDTLIDLLTATKYIHAELVKATDFEGALFAGLPQGGSASGEDAIKEAEAILSTLQLVAELMHCTFEQAKQVDYADAMLAVSVRAKEIEKERTKLSKN